MEDDMCNFILRYVQITGSLSVKKAEDLLRRRYNYTSSIIHVVREINEVLSFNHQEIKIVTDDIGDEQILMFVSKYEPIIDKMCYSPRQIEYFYEIVEEIITSADKRITRDYAINLWNRVCERATSENQHLQVNIYDASSEENVDSEVSTNDDNVYDIDSDENDEVSINDVDDINVIVGDENDDGFIFGGNINIIVNINIIDDSDNDENNNDDGYDDSYEDDNNSDSDDNGVDDDYSDDSGIICDENSYDDDFDDLINALFRNDDDDADVYDEIFAYVNYYDYDIANNEYYEFISDDDDVDDEDDMYISDNDVVDDESIAHISHDVNNGDDDVDSNGNDDDKEDNKSAWMNGDQPANSPEELLNLWCQIKYFNLIDGEYAFGCRAVVEFDGVDL